MRVTQKRASSKINKTKTPHFLSGIKKWHNPISHKTLKNIFSWSRQYPVELLLVGFATILFIASLPYLFSNDEAAYLLNGKQIIHGILPYRDYFFHHMPGMDLLSAFLYLFSGANLFVYRVLFNILLFGLLLLNTRLIYKSFGRTSARLYLLLIPLFHIVWLHVAIGTSLIAYLAPSCFLLIWETNKATSKKKIAVIGLILFLIPFINLGYTLVALVLYLLLASRILFPLDKKWRSTTLRAGLILATPYIVFVISLVALGVLNEFIFSNWAFNQQYYAPLIQDRVYGSLGLLPRLLNNSLSQISTLLLSFSPTYILQLLLLLSFPVAAFVLWKNNQKIFAVGALALLLVINPRYNLYTPPGITSSLAETVNYGSVYKSFALFLAAISIPLLLRQSLSFKDRIISGASRVYAYAFLLLVPLLLLQYTTQTLVKIVLDKQDVNFVAYALHTAPQKAQKIDSILEPGDSYWIGPVDFDTQIYARSTRSTSYSFYLPWIDSCDSCRDKLVHQLQEEKPKIIIWHPFSLDGKIYTYSQDFRQLLDKEYSPVKETAWEGYYIRNDWRDQFTNKTGVDLKNTN